MSPGATGPEQGAGPLGSGVRSEAGGPPRLGISSCLLGREVRYDGGHKHDRFLTHVLGPFVEWVPVCPEVEIGLGTPRPPIRLERSGGEGEVRLVMPSTGEDLTARMRDYADGRAAALARLELSGYVLKKDSPSCGMERVRVHGGRGAPARRGRGVFAEALIAALPWLPVEEEGRLNDPRLRENFISRVFALWRWRQLERVGITRSALIAFHQRHKLHLMARNQAGARRLGRLLGEAGRGGTAALAARYLEGFTGVLSRPPTRRSHANVLQHLAGQVSDRLEKDDRSELSEAIHAYRRGLTPLIVPLTLLRHYARKFDVRWMREQVYLEPHPHELMLLNHV